mmetsp:Transcript_38111/g.53696  ORF Transcript_38111/g.53696 Transcript_38111/m.53696 type:complete len:228 (+) Transcript_38111:117-800(+)|eukprot:CAMPEP_0202446190 /NCGR_PEP_ID=MMETSP1360-20130828/4782_1 /ASSEMBLY_ACC=CAM_ASM_000848 /TAXON_ID=515479 /ORGANISM="Licmophora paradoxa, Strain CCMP2313" /LENGTH=227 /DNA_ID=CAMNT_0049062633 /DNA_START=109 /DNA_END=792 /DNA_ORIENTATION=-
MKLPASLVFAISLLTNTYTTTSFVITTTPARTASTKSVTSEVVLFGQPELVAEPEGGDELVAKSTMEDTRMKKMGVVEGKKSENGVVCDFWLSTIVNGKLIKELKMNVLKDAKKKANFPGFRKGQIPPYAMPQITGFAVQEAIIKTVESAIDAFGLNSLPGSEGEVNVLEDVKDMTKGYKDGESIKFTATLKCAMEPEEEKVEVASVESVSEDNVIDAEIVEEPAAE